MTKSLAFLGLLAVCAAHADNAALTSGGQPKMMDHHPTVRMESEAVKLTVHWDRVDTDCSFVFANDGPACVVNMGFPDFGLLAYSQKLTEPASMFTKYASYVDGKPVSTKLVLGQGPGEQWQTKKVAFPAHGKRLVREVYSTELGGVGVRPPIALASYLLHTGASWKGTIGKAVVTVTVAPDCDLTGPLDPLYGTLQQSFREKGMARLRKPNGVIVTGPCQPQVQGLTLTFVKENWRPTKNDDILVGFTMPPKMLRKIEAAYNQKMREKTRPQSHASN